MHLPRKGSGVIPFPGGDRVVSPFLQTDKERQAMTDNTNGKMVEVMEALSRPFPADVISWKPARYEACVDSVRKVAVCGG